MSKPEFSETDIQRSLRHAENQIDRQTLSELAGARELAISSQNKWMSEFKGLFSAGAVTAALVVALVLPVDWNGASDIPQGVDIADDNLQLLMEDPEFFLWVSSSYSSLSQ